MNDASVSGGGGEARAGRIFACLAGAAAAATALSAAELLSRLVPDVPSLVAAVGAVVIDRTPDNVRIETIERFGTADKPILVVAIALVVLLLGGLGGIMGRPAPGSGLRFRPRPRLAVVPVAVSVIGLAAAVGRVGASAPGGLAAAGALLGSWIAIVVVLLRVASPAQASAPTDRSRIGATRHPATSDDLGGRPVPATPAPVSTSRRTFVVATAGVVAAAGGMTFVARGTTARTRALVARARLRLPRPRDPAPTVPGGATYAVPGLTPLRTPNAAFYRIDTALRVPAIDPDDWRLEIGGLIERPYALSLDDLLAMDLVEADITMACVSNPVGGPLVSTARWLGVPLTSLLDRARPTSPDLQVVGRSVDGFTAGFPLELTRDGRHALVAIGMNGEPLPLEHGFPARLVVPGLYGYTSATKWLRRIELRPRSYDAYWVPRGYAKDGPIGTQSRIDVPKADDRLDAGNVVIAGLAWAPGRGIRTVEIQVDDDPWQDAELAVSTGDDVWRAWRLNWAATPGDHVLRVRATDGTGRTQDADYTRPLPRGATGYDVARVRVR